MVVCQVPNDMPTCEVKEDSRNIKVIHHNRLFLVAPTRERATPLGGGESISYVSAAWSALAELTPLECEGETSESEVESMHTWCLPSHVLLRWADGVLRPLPSVALRLTVSGLGSGEGSSSFSDEDVH